ncbi:MAG TPA: septal ring lytic transglycosylase RlpA family protein [Gammaproteobacteria bacterium]|nr:septal ring lytic transglycosylase RlpA family protein [Gammaproteobacteria bacterium]
MRPERGTATLRLSALLLVAALAGCAGLPRQDGAPAPSRIPDNITRIPNAKPRKLPRSPYGNPSSYKVDGHVYHVLKSAAGYEATGVASWYGTKFHGHRTASGEPYDMFAMTAAHRTLPIPSFVRVTDLRNGRSVVVKINDRGPFADNRLIDLSYAAAAKLHMLKHGTAPVRIRAITPGHPSPGNEVLAHGRGAAKGRAAEPDPPHGVYVQVGAFRQRDHAERLRQRLAHAGLAVGVSIQRVEDAGRALFRVHLGPVRSRARLGQLHHALAARGIAHTEVIGRFGGGGDR